MITENNCTPIGSTAVETAVAHIDENFTLVSTLLLTDTADASYFSIAVSLYTDDPRKSDTRLIRDITRNRTVALSLFHSIVDGTVTPVSLADVLEDLL